MPTPEDRINTMIALVNSSASIANKNKSSIKIEFRQVNDVNGIAPPPRKNILKILHSTRALDSTLESFLDYHGIKGASHSIGQYISQLTNHTLSTLGKLSIQERTKYQNEIVIHRNKYLHKANSYPLTDRDVYKLISEMEALISRVVGL
jgi:hypothetical protein